MRLTRLSIIVVVLLSASTLAQVRGGTARGFVGRPGVVMSPHHGGRFFVGFNNRPFFNNGPFVRFGFRHGFRHFNSFPNWGGIWDGGYAFSEGDYAVDPQPEDQQTSLLPSRLEVTIVDQRENKESDDPAAKKLPDAKLIEIPAEPAIFIFKDGTRKEMTSFAITGGQLIDLSKGKVFRTPLDRINRKATLAANAKAGHEIQLP
jgi:hypothetical protein